MKRVTPIFRCCALVPLIFLMNAACTFKGTIPDDFHQPRTEHAQKIPLKIALVSERSVQSQRFVASWGATNAIEIGFSPALVKSIKSELESIFEGVKLSESGKQIGDENLLALLSFDLRQQGSDYWSGRTEAHCRIQIIFKDARTKSQITKVERSIQITYIPPSNIIADVLSIVPPLVLWPITLPWISSDMEQRAIETFENELRVLVQAVSDDVRDDQKLLAFSTGTPPTAIQPAIAAKSDERLASSTSDVDTLPSLGSSRKNNGYAIVIGIEKYREQLPRANFAAHDAKLMGEYLTKVLGYPEENVVVRLNEKATRTDFEKYVESWLPNRVDKDGSVFIYFSGHGAPNPKTGDAYLVPYDGDPAFIDKTGYPLKRLYEYLAKLPVKEVVVMLDSCFSGAGGRSVIAEGTRPMMLSIENPILASGRTVVLAASSGSQVSSTYKEKGHGLLTYFFLKGLQGEADRNKDGNIDLAELFEYAKPQIERTARREFNNEQTPQLLGSPEFLSKGVRLLERTNK